MQEWHVQKNVFTKNVPFIGEHTGNLPICSQNTGTLHNTCTILSTNNSRTTKTCQYNSHTFQLKDGHFLYDNLNFKLPQRNNISTFQRVALSLGLLLQFEDGEQEFDIEKNSNSFRDLLHTLTSLALKDLSIVNNNFSHHKQYAYGENVFEVYLKSSTGSGRISSSDRNIRWLNEQDTLDLKSELFTTSGYQNSSHSMKYSPTSDAEKIMKTVFKLLKSVDFVHNNLKDESLDFTVTIDNLANIKLRDTMLLLSKCIGYKNGFIIRPKITDHQYSRVYSIFTSIGSHTRKNLGFHNYDIGAALQTICLHLVENTALYPLHQEYVENKIDFRYKIQKETRQNDIWVKKELSKINNLDQMPKKYNHYPTLVAYYKEALQLRKEIIDTAEPDILSRARDCAKIRYKPIWTEIQKEPQFVIDGKKESSIFFFVWSTWERQIRQSMMSCFAEPSSCHQVHDAVYSKQIIDPQMIEDKVLNDTGFKVNIYAD